MVMFKRVGNVIFNVPQIAAIKVESEAKAEVLLADGRTVQFDRKEDVDRLLVVADEDHYRVRASPSGRPAGADGPAGSPDSKPTT